MKKLKEIALWFVSGLATGLFFVILLFRNKTGNEINIKKQVQRNRKSPNNKQEYSSEIKSEPKRKFKRLKRKRDGNS